MWNIFIHNNFIRIKTKNQLDYSMIFCLVCAQGEMPLNAVAYGR